MKRWIFTLCAVSLAGALLIVRIHPLEVSIAGLALLAITIAVGLATNSWGGLLASAGGAFAVILFHQYTGLYTRGSTVLNVTGTLMAFLLVGPLAGHLSGAVGLLRTQADHWLVRAEELTVHDDLLGSLKPAWARVRIEEEIERATQFHRPLSALVILIQPKGRGPAGSQCKRVATLKALIRIAQAATRTPSVVTHLGDDRVIILLPEYTASQAGHLARTLRARWHDERCFPDDAATTLGTPAAGCGSLEIGLSSLNGHKPTVDAFLAQATSNEQGEPIV